MRFITRNYSRADGLIKPQTQEDNFSGYINPINGMRKIFSREDISKMSSDEYCENEQNIFAQMRLIGIPTNNELQNASFKGKTIYVHSYIRKDGTKVRGYYRSV